MLVVNADPGRIQANAQHDTKLPVCTARRGWSGRLTRVDEVWLAPGVKLKSNAGAAWIEVEDHLAVKLFRRDEDGELVQVDTPPV